MSQQLIRPKMKQQLVEPEVKQQVELKASQILRMTKVDQCRNSYHRDGKFCAMGAIMNYFGWNGTVGTMNSDRFNNLKLITYWGSITHMNDIDCKSFNEIADWLEERGL